jgi:hypothetical protein
MKSFSKILDAFSFSAQSKRSSDASDLSFTISFWAALPSIFFMFFSALLKIRPYKVKKQNLTKFCSISTTRSNKKLTQATPSNACMQGNPKNLRRASLIIWPLASENLCYLPCNDIPQSPSSPGININSPHALPRRL